jgi:hypothetical protein
MLGKTPHEPVTGKIVFPDLRQLENRTIQELKQLRIKNFSTHQS